jgi:hypothetical protein
MPPAYCAGIAPRFIAAIARLVAALRIGPCRSSEVVDPDANLLVDIADERIA